MDAKQIEAIKARLEAANVGEVERSGAFIYELTLVEPRIKGFPESENKWFAAVHGDTHLTPIGLCKIAVLFQHAPGDIRALLDRVEELESLARRQHEMLDELEFCDGASEQRSACPKCGFYSYGTGHYDGCDLSDILTEGRKLLEGK